MSGERLPNTKQPAIKTNQEVTLSFWQSKPVGLKDEVEILLEIKNISLSMNDIPAGARIQVTGGIFYEPVLILLTDPIPLNRSKAMNFFLVPTGNAELHTLPDAISVKLFVKSVQIFSRDTGFEIEMGFLSL